MAILKVSNLYYSYYLDEQVIPVLENISFEIQKGEMVAIQGASGSGKSTLLYLLGGLLILKRGSILIDGFDLSAMNPNELAYFRNQKMGYIFQQFHLLPKANTLENILLPTHYRPKLKKGETKNDIVRAKDLASLVGIDNRLGHFPNQLSGGQQQRVAVARSLMNDPEIILADEPTGNLDSKSSEQILELLKKLNHQGKTIIIITHDSHVAGQCDRILHIKDGRIENKLSDIVISERGLSHKKKIPSQTFSKLTLINLLKEALSNLLRHKVRSTLTMLGITIGIAAILSMLTLGLFTKEKILDSYIELGINSLLFQGYPNWNTKATDIYPVPFEAFNWDYDIKPLYSIFPQIKHISPALISWGSRIIANGKTIEDSKIFGVNRYGLKTTNKKLSLGENFNQYHIDNRSPVCIIGMEIAKSLFYQKNPLGKQITIEGPNSSYNCLVIGVLENQKNNKEWIRNRDVFAPYTFLQTSLNNWWTSRIHEFIVEFKPNTDMVNMGKSLKGYFKIKYGNSGQFFPNSEILLIGHMQRFLNLFTLLLTVIAIISLFVGGIGVTNMMLVSVSERFREIGLKKALGATDQLIQRQFLLESFILCSFAGILGIVFGVFFYELAIFGATKLVPQLTFEWIFNFFAFTLSTFSIVFVGFFSGLFPAIKAKKLQIIEALRSE